VEGLPQALPGLDRFAERLPFLVGGSFPPVVVVTVEPEGAVGVTDLQVERRQWHLVNV